MNMLELSVANLSVMVVEDNPGLREALDMLLARAGCRVVGAAATVEDGVAIYTRERPDVVVSDYEIGDARGTDLLLRLRAVNPDVRVVVFTGTTDQAAHVAILDGRARGLALKGSRAQVLFEAVRRVGAGGTFVDPAVRLAPRLGFAA